MKRCVGRLTIEIGYTLFRRNGPSKNFWRFKSGGDMLLGYRYHEMAAK